MKEERMEEEEKCREWLQALWSKMGEEMGVKERHDTVAEVEERHNTVVEVEERHNTR